MPGCAGRGAAMATGWQPGRIALAARRGDLRVLSGGDLCHSLETKNVTGGCQKFWRLLLAKNIEVAPYLTASQSAQPAATPKVKILYSARLF